MRLLMVGKISNKTRLVGILVVDAIINPAPPKTFLLPLVKRFHTSTFLDPFDFWAIKGPTHVPRNRQLTSMQAYLELFELL